MRAPAPSLREGLFYLIVGLLALAVIAHGSERLPAAAVLEASLK